MINTLYSLNLLGSPNALFIALLIGFGFGFALERAGFSSSRRLAGVFYFKDMAVIKVMFSALVTAGLGLSYLVVLGWIRLDQVFLMPTIYGAQIVGGILFGIGFVMGAWCPGTAAAGLAAGRIDALVFLIGAVGGSIIFNETFPILKPLYGAGDKGVLMVYGSLGMSRKVFMLILTLIAAACFWLCEWAEKAQTKRSDYLGSPFLKAFSLALIVAAAGLFVPSPAGPAAPDESTLMATVEKAGDHIEPEELADRLMAGERSLLVVDVRPAEEYEAFHIRGAINVPLGELADVLHPHKNQGLIVLYSNGMTHPAQARDSLQRQGFENVYMLTDGLQGFRERCLKPVSLRAAPMTPAAAASVNAWRAFFSGQTDAGLGQQATVSVQAGTAPALAEVDWLASMIGTPGVKIVDLRPQPEYNTAHIPGSLSLSVESLRGNVGGVPSLLLPAPMLAAQFSLLGLSPTDMIVLVSGDKFHDATLAGMACERLGHTNYTVLNGGYNKWAEAGLPVDTILPTMQASQYPVVLDADQFTVDYRAVRDSLGKPGVVIIDVRPEAFYSGSKSDEARAGHIPGAVNRPYTSDVIVSSNKVTVFKTVQDLSAAYQQLVPATDSEIILHCRTGHQASQTYFVLKRLLGYSNVLWYDAGWTEWAARAELPVVK